MRTEFPLRLAVLLSFFAIPLAAVAQTALPAPVEGHDVTEIGPGYYTFRHKGLRNIFLVTKAGVIVTDPIEPEAARVLREEIRKITPLPARSDR